MVNKIQRINFLKNKEMDRWMDDAWGSQKIVFFLDGVDDDHWMGLRDVCRLFWIRFEGLLLEGMD